MSEGRVHRTKVSQAATLKNAARLAVLAAVAFACLGSLLYVSDTNAPLKASNHWQQLDSEESNYNDIKKTIGTLAKLPEDKLAGHLSALSALSAEPDKKRARDLALIYRQQGKQEKAAEIYRLLWLAGDKTFNSEDGLALAAVYTDMGGFPSAILSYQKILAYDQSSPAPADQKARDALLARDLNNLGQCYYTVACATAQPDLRQKYLLWARAQFVSAAKLTSTDHDSYVIESNLKMADIELGGQSPSR